MPLTRVERSLGDQTKGLENVSAGKDKIPIIYSY